MNICVVGAGYVGLVTSACLAYLGNKVVTVESNPARLDELAKGKVPFFEPGLQEFVSDCLKSKTIKFSSDISQAVKSSQVIFIAVGTPSKANGEPDLSQVMTVARSIGGALDSEQRRVIVNKSTVPVGSGNWVEMLVNQGVEQMQAQTVPARKSKPDAPSFSVVSNPEFLREGTCLTKIHS